MTIEDLKEEIHNNLHNVDYEERSNYGIINALSDAFIKYESINKNSIIPDVSGSVNGMLDTIHDNLIDKGFDCYNADATLKEVDEYKLTFKMVADELRKHYR